MSQELIIVIGMAVLFGFLNGMRDSSNIVATMISSRAFSPQSALAITAAAEFVGPFLFGVVVAKTIGADVIDASSLSLNVIAACLIGAIVWNMATWFFGIPGSSSHALIGGLIGAVIVAGGVYDIKFAGLYKILIALVTAPIVGFVGGFLLTRLIYFLAQNATPRINLFFSGAQLFTAVALGLSHGTNDSQKTMGVITLSLIIGGVLPAFQVPFWVIVISAAAISIGSIFGGWRMIRTLGGKFYKIRPLHSFATQLTSSLVMISASLLGAPVSVSHVVSSAIIGVGSSERVSKIRWSVAGDIVMAWLITIPASGLLSAGVYWVITRLT